MSRDSIKQSHGDRFREYINKWQQWTPVIRRTRGMREMLYSGECHQIFGEYRQTFPGMSSSILRNVLKHYGERCQTFWGIFWNIPGNVLKHSRECSQTFQETFQKITGNLNFGLFREILHVFYQTLLLNCYKTKEKTQPRFPISGQIFWKKIFTLIHKANLFGLITIFLDYFFLFFLFLLLR